MIRLLSVIAFLLIFSPATAQQNIPLMGPLVAAVPASQDRIILYDTGSSTRRELSFGTGWHTVWGFSPDGCEILFTLTEGSGLGRAYIASIDGKQMRDLVQYTEPVTDQWGIWEPQWSPDGSKIAFKILRDGFEGNEERQYHIAWVTPEGGEPQFYSRTGREHTPLWSPDSQWLAYVSYEERPAGADIYSTAEPAENQAAVTMLSEADLWIVSADGETKYALTNFSVGSVSMPRWSPDSQLLSFVYSPAPNNDTQWIIANQQGALATQLTYNWNLALDLTWQPDGAVLIGALRDFRARPDNHLWRLPLVGNADNDGTLYLDNNRYPFPDYPRFSPDGTMLAFRTYYGLAIIETATQTEIMLDTVNIGNTPPVWSPLGFEGEKNCKNL
jgi:Tol biopolymer transport system component